MAKPRAEDIALNAQGEVPIIIGKYLMDRDDIAPEMKRVLSIIYRGQVHLVAEWATIVHKRLNKPAD